MSNLWVNAQKVFSMQNLRFQILADYFRVPCELDWLITGYQIDSRLIKEGNLFFALKGEKTDGHLHLSDAKKRGAIAAVVDKNYPGSDFGLFLLFVEDVERALQQLAQFSLSLQAPPPRIIGITGSVGKTTTKDFVAELLSKKYKVFKTPHSYNSKLTFPLNLLNRSDEEILVLEMGMSEAGEIGSLVQIAAPDIAVLTKISLAHAAFFPNGLEDIVKEKLQIFSSPKTQIAIFPDEISLETSAKKICFSLQNRNADYFLSVLDGRVYVDERGVRAYQFDLPFKQSHIVYNFLIAVTVARQMKMEWDEINQQINTLRLPAMRFEQFEKNGIFFVNDAYNANPESMRSALLNFPEPKENGKRIAVFGTMKELGGFSKNAHEEIGFLAQRIVDHLLVIGEEALILCETFAQVQKPAEYFLDLKALAERLKALMCPGDVVLVKGSRSMHLEHLFDLLI
jgi:UDP-N-acetylmuramoyl-tripeptide--D-alanyl-D-alanine ligase